MADSLIGIPNAHETFVLLCSRGPFLRTSRE